MPTTVKLFKLIAHQKNFSGTLLQFIIFIFQYKILFFTEEELVLSSKDFPHIKLRDIIEVYQPDVPGSSKILLQLHSLKDEMQNKGLYFLQGFILHSFFN